MLTALHIENFALIDALDLDFQSGLNVLTGETGAGKSIILDALDAVLGGKANQRLVRSGTDKAIVEAVFEVSPAIRTWLADHDFSGNSKASDSKAPDSELSDRKASDSETSDSTMLVCRRELTLSKTSVRSRSYLNGQQINKTHMEDLRQLLVEITAQGQTVQVGSPDLQRQWLDEFGGEALLSQRQTVSQAYEAASQAKRKLDNRRRAEQERLEKLDLLQLYQKELDQANLDDPEELENLIQENQRLSHTVELQQNSYQVYQILYESDSEVEACADLLGKAESILVDMEQYDGEITPILTLVSEALTQVQEAGRAMNAYGSAVEADPQRLEEVEQRMRQLKNLCRKYGRSLPELIEYRDEVQATLAELSDDGQSIEDLEADFQQRQAVLEADCAELTQLRQQAAQNLEARLVAELKPLAMDRVQFKVDLRPIAPTATGADAIQFLFSPNPGEPLQPLAETASGGEMSRFLLALKACFSQVDSIGTMVFDEIDVGVSGRVAQAIAEKLFQLGRQHQVLCVTHQPMVAAMADSHFHVGKHVVDSPSATAEPSPKSSKKKKTKQSQTAKTPSPDANGTHPEAIRTVVRVVPLSQTERREELAQLAGGDSHQESLSFAEVLLAQANTIREKFVTS